jgi:hypothetical protein
MSFQKSLNENGFGESSNLFGCTTHTLLNKLHGMSNIGFVRVLYLPTDAKESCFKKDIKIYIKTAPTCFGLITTALCTLLLVVLGVLLLVV